jgi:hypothetical protein
MTTISDIKEAASTAKEKVQEVRRTASNLVGQAGTGSEEALHTAASAIRNAGAQSADVIDGIAETAGRKFASAASFLEPSGESCSMAEDLRKMVLRHPGAFLILAAAFAGTVGFMAGSSRNGNGGSNY